MKKLVFVNQRGTVVATKHVPEGFSWTCLFFGPFPMLFAGQMKMFCIWVGLFLASVLLFAPITIVTTPLMNAVFAWMRNDMVISDLRVAGWITEAELAEDTK